MNKKFFYIVGPENSGTRITTKLLVAAGCEGDYEHKQRLDSFVDGEVFLADTFFPEPGLVVYRHSIPHGHVLPNILKTIWRFESEGYNTVIILICRDWFANVLSQSQPERLTLQKAVVNVENAWRHIFRQLAFVNTPFYIFNTSFMFKDPWAAIKGLEWFTNLTIPEEVIKEVYDTDKKFYGGAYG